MTASPVGHKSAGVQFLPYNMTKFAVFQWYYVLAIYTKSLIHRKGYCMMEKQWDSEKIGKVDTTKAEEFLTREKIRRILNLPSHKEFTIIQWQNPKCEVPQDGTYVIIKEPAGQGLGFLCTDVAYENGQFWYIWPDYKPVPARNVLLWTYAPFDDRINSLGQILPEYK